MNVTEFWRKGLQLDTLEAEHGLPAGLLTAVMQQESSGNPNAYNSKAGAAGLFQFIPATAEAYGIDPYNPKQAARAAAQELHSLYTKYQGDVPKTLAGWNWGQGRVDRLGMERAPAETRGFIQRVTGFLSPASAEAATPASPAPVEDDATAILARLKARQQPTTAPAQETALPADTATAEEASARVQQLRDAQPPDGERPQIAIEKAHASEPDATAGAIAWLPGFEWLSLLPEAAQQRVIETVPGIVTPEAAKFAAATGINVALTTAGGATGVPVGPGGVLAGGIAGSVLAREVNKALGLEEQGDLGDALALFGPFLGEVPRAAKGILRHLPGVRRARQALETADTATAQQFGAAEAQYVDDVARTRATQQAATEQALTDRPSPFTTPEVEARRTLRTGRDTARQTVHAEREADRLAQYQRRVAEAEQQAMAANADTMRAYAARGDAARQQAMTAAQEQQTAYRQARQAYDDAVAGQAGAVSRAQAIPGKYLPQMPDDVPPSPGARPAPAPTFADDPYKTADGKWKVPLKEVPSQELELQDLLRQPDQRGRWGINLSDDELFGEFDALLGRAESGSARLKNSKSGLTTQEAASRAHELGFIDSPDTDSLLRALDDSVRGARPVYSVNRTPPEVVVSPTPGTPRPAPEGAAVSHRLYSRLAEIAGDAPVYLAYEQDKIASLLAEIDPVTALQPSAARLQTILTTLKDLDKTDVKAVNALLADLRPLTSAVNGKLRYTAAQTMDLLSDAVIQTGRDVPETAAAGRLMQQARAAFRKEKAVETLERALQTGGPVVTRDAEGRQVINVKNALNTLERLLNKDRFFAGSFSREELTALRKEFDDLVGTPTIPRTRPEAPAPVEVADIGPPPTPVEPRAVPPFTPRPLRALAQTAQPPASTLPLRDDLPSFTLPAPVQPSLTPPSPGRLLRDFLVGGGGVAIYGQRPGLGLMLGTATAAGDYLSYTLARALLSQEGRTALRRLMLPGGQLRPDQVGVLNNLLRLPAPDESPPGNTASPLPPLQRGRQ